MRSRPARGPPPALGLRSRWLHDLVRGRLVEAGVPFITVFWMGNRELDTLCKSGGGWDTHGNNFACLKEDLLPEFDRCFSALIEDLDQRRLLGQLGDLRGHQCRQFPIRGRHRRLGHRRSQT